MKNKEMRSEVSQLTQDSIMVFDNPEYDDAVIGYARDATNESVHVVYDYQKMVEIAATRNLGRGEDEEDAFENGEMLVQDAMSAMSLGGKNHPLIMEPLESIG